MTAEEIQVVVEQVLAKMGVVTTVHPDAPSPSQEYFSIKNCSAVTGVSTDHIRRAIVGGTLVASDVGTKAHPLYRVHRDNLKKWMEEREGGCKPPARRGAPIVSKYYQAKARKQSV